jgi:retron-type reverse transcriptase
MDSFIQFVSINLWVLDLDIRGFCDSIDHGWLVKFIEHRIADQRVVRLIQKWLNAGVLEDGKRTQVEAGTPAGRQRSGPDAKSFSPTAAPESRPSALPSPVASKP